MKIVIIFFSLIFVHELSQANVSQDEWITCSGIKIDSERLKCFDFAVTSELEKINPPDGLGNWVVSVEKNSFNDSTIVTFLLYGILKIPDIEYRIENFYINITCSMESIDISLQSGDPRFSSFDRGIVYYNNSKKMNHAISVVTRVDKDKSFISYWDTRKDFDVPYNQQPSEFIGNLMGSHSLMFGIPRRYNDESMLASFITVGLSDALKPWREVCGL